MDNSFEYSQNNPQSITVSSSDDTLILTVLNDGLPGLTKAWGKLLSEAGAYCLERQNHASGVVLKVKGLTERKFQVYWSGATTEQVKNAWDDEQDLVEFGACGIAIAALLKLTDFTVIRRARKGTRVDYWLGNRNATQPFQDAARLEISGIMNGDAASVKARVNKKLKQIEKGESSLPAFIAVIEFSEPISHVVKK